MSQSITNYQLFTFNQWSFLQIRHDLVEPFLVMKCVSLNAKPLQLAFTRWLHGARWTRGELINHRPDFTCWLLHGRTYLLSRCLGRFRFRLLFLFFCLSFSFSFCCFSSFSFFNSSFSFVDCLGLSFPSLSGLLFSILNLLFQVNIFWLHALFLFVYRGRRRVPACLVSLIVGSYLSLTDGYSGSLLFLGLRGVGFLFVLCFLSSGSSISHRFRLRSLCLGFLGCSPGRVSLFFGLLGLPCFGPLLFQSSLLRLCLFPSFIFLELGPGSCSFSLYLLVFGFSILCFFLSCCFICGLFIFSCFISFSFFLSR